MDFAPRPLFRKKTSNIASGCQSGRAAHELEGGGKTGRPNP
jgi:hypothetical protein